MCSGGIYLDLIVKFCEAWQHAKVNLKGMGAFQNAYELANTAAQI